MCLYGLADRILVLMVYEQKPPLNMCRSRGGGGGGGAKGLDLPPPLGKSQKYRVFFSNTGLDPLKIVSYQASIQCWATIGMPAKRHLNGVSLAGR